MPGPGMENWASNAPGSCGWISEIATGVCLAFLDNNRKIHLAVDASRSESESEDGGWCFFLESIFTD